MVERAALEMRYTRKRIEGSNPPLSAKKGRFVCLSLLKQANRSFILQGCRRQTLGLRRNPPLYGLSILFSKVNAPPIVLTCWMVA